MNTEQRLTQVEKLTETIARYIDRHEQRFEQTQGEMDQLRTKMGKCYRFLANWLNINGKVKRKWLNIENKLEQIK